MTRTTRTIEKFWEKSEPRFLFQVKGLTMDLVNMVENPKVTQLKHFTEHKYKQTESVYS